MENKLYSLLGNTCFHTVYWAIPASNNSSSIILLSFASSLTWFMNGSFSHVRSTRMLQLEGMPFVVFRSVSDFAITLRTFCLIIGPMSCSSFLIFEGGGCDGVGRDCDEDAGEGVSSLSFSNDCDVVLLPNTLWDWFADSESNVEMVWNRSSSVLDSSLKATWGEILINNNNETKLTVHTMM